MNGVITNVPMLNNLQYRRIQRGHGANQNQRKRLEELNALLLTDLSIQRRFVLNNRNRANNEILNNLQVIGQSPAKQTTELTVIDGEIEQDSPDFDYKFDID